MTRHLRIVGERRADRLSWIAAECPDGVLARCHRRLRGPYTGVDTVLAAVLPHAVDRWPELVEHHRMELLYGMPELAKLIGPAPRTLASESVFKERTRFYGSLMIRCMSQGIVTFLTEHARRVVNEGAPAPMLVFDEVHEAEPTTQEFLALLVRRADPQALRVVVGGTERLPSDELESALSNHADSVVVEPSTVEPAGSPDPDAVAAYVASDGTSDDPAELAAYQRADPDVVRRLHDRRADELEPGATWGTRIEALAYHREHGSDPTGAGRHALLAAQEYCTQVGFSAAVADLGMRGRAVTDPVTQQSDYCQFTMQAASALVSTGGFTESLELYQELRRRYTEPKIHMITSYTIAMLHTRFVTPRDHETALAWQNNAAVLARLLPERRERLVYGVFQDNGLALVEMHRGNLTRALHLVEDGIRRLDAELGDEEWALHRSQLLYNRARLLVALGRADEAYADFTTLIDLDPYYTDYLSERARISRRRGDFGAALADYDRAARLGPPFPELYYNRGTARVETGDLDGAMEDFGYVLAMEPGDLDTRLSRAELLMSIGDLDAAEADLRAGLLLRPGEPRLLCLHGAIHLERRAWQDAVDLFDAALAADPEYPAALLNRAVAHFELGHAGIAVDDLTTTLQIVGDDPDVLLNRGLAYQASGRPDLAVTDFDRAMRLPGADLAELRRHRTASLTGRIPDGSAQPVPGHRPG